MKTPRIFRPTTVTVAALILISAIITWASFSFAVGVKSVMIGNAQYAFDPSSMIMQVSGRLPNPCTVQPHPVLALTPNPNVLMLEIKADRTSHICETMVGGAYRLAFDVRSLKFDLAKLNINPNANYTIITSNNAVRFTFNFAEVPYTLPFATSVLPSTLLQVNQNGNFIVTGPNGQTLVMNSPLINLQNFVGHKVEVEGHIVDVSRPGFSPLQPETAQPMEILVTGLSSTAL